MLYWSFYIFTYNSSLSIIIYKKLKYIKLKLPRCEFYVGETRYSKKAKGDKLLLL